MCKWMILAISTVAIGSLLAQTKPAAPRPAASPAAARGAAAQPAPSKDEQTIFDLANRERAARQLPALKWSSGLAAAARPHAQKMAQAGTISHQFPGEPDMGTRIRSARVLFSAAAENVAQGPSAEFIHQLWMDSPPHRSNILDPELDSLGVAIAERNGEFFAVQDFARALQ